MASSNDTRSRVTSPRIELCISFFEQSNLQLIKFYYETTMNVLVRICLKCYIKNRAHRVFYSKEEYWYRTVPLSPSLGEEFCQNTSSDFNVGSQM